MDLAQRFTRVHVSNADYSTYLHPVETGVTNWPYPSWTAYKHHQWIMFTPEAIKFFRTDPRALTFLAFAEFTLIPDESYFATGI